MLLSRLKGQRVLDPEKLSGMQVLDNCPFCGRRALPMQTSPESGFVTYYIQCTVCKATTDFALTPLLAAVKWNHRQ